ncbi:hypothetical protein TCCBUS3UF1_21980 [Thermus sp. CCB_US3_UF1]|nr:hypothetical protein TCCBUS3UF1_21980 [Thermus sp. CCB_US3_UF1]
MEEEGCTAGKHLEVVAKGLKPRRGMFFLRHERNLASPDLYDG